MHDHYLRSNAHALINFLSALFTYTHACLQGLNGHSCIYAQLLPTLNAGVGLAVAPAVPAAPSAPSAGTAATALPQVGLPRSYLASSIFKQSSLNALLYKDPW